jgi:hypothetical protein
LILLVGGDGFEPPTLSVLVRQFLSMTIAPGGVGKSSLIATETLAMVTGRALLGVKPDRPLKVWLWNLEDPQIETARKIQAACLHYGIKREEIEGRLFANSGRDQPLVIAKTLRAGVVILHPVVDDLVKQIKEQEIDVLVIDPFVSCHEVEENDNSGIDMVAKEWSRVAELGNCAVHIIHHTRKAPAGTEVTTESGRGAKAPSDACRIAGAINQMTDEQAKVAGVDNPRSNFRAYNDKANLAPPTSVSDWFGLASVPLGTLGVADRFNDIAHVRRQPRQRVQSGDEKMPPATGDATSGPRCCDAVRQRPDRPTQTKIYTDSRPSCATARCSGPRYPRG